MLFSIESTTANPVLFWWTAGKRSTDIVLTECQRAEFKLSRYMPRLNHAITRLWEFVCSNNTSQETLRTLFWSYLNKIKCTITEIIPWKACSLVFINTPYEKVCRHLPFRKQIAPLPCPNWQNTFKGHLCGEQWVLRIERCAFLSKMTGSFGKC